MDIREVIAWPQGDLFQLINDTQPIRGNLESFLPAILKESIQAAIVNNSANLYHVACHCFLYDKNQAQSLVYLYKVTFFILQAINYLQTWKYRSSKKELAAHLDGCDAEILDICINRAEIPNYNQQQVETAYAKLIDWCSRNMICS